MKLLRSLTFGAIALGLAGCGGGGGTFGTYDSSPVFMTQGSQTVGGPSMVYERSLLTQKAASISEQGLNCGEADYCNMTGMMVYVQTTAPTAANPTLVSNLYVISKSGAAPVQKTTTSAVRHNPRFSPDGSWIVYTEDMTSANGSVTTSAVFKVPAAGGAAVEKQISPAQGICAWPSVSPDGQTVLFSMNTAPGTGTYQIYTVQIAGGGITPVTNDTNDYRSPMYNFDRSKILCAMDPAATTLLTTPPPPQWSVVELPVGNIQSPNVLAMPLAPVLDTLSQVTTWSSYGHPRYSESGKFVVFDNSNFSALGTAAGTCQICSIYRWSASTGQAVAYGNTIAPIEQIQGDE